MSEQIIFSAATIAAIAALGLVTLAWRNSNAMLRQMNHLVSLLTEQNRRNAVERFRDEDELYRALARLLADAIGAPTELVPGSLSCAVTPTPFLTTTRIDGLRIYVTQQPRILRQIRLLRSDRRAIDVTHGTTTHKAEMCAIWEAVCARIGGPQTAMPAHRDWYALLVHVTTSHAHDSSKSASRSASRSAS